MNGYARGIAALAVAIAAAGCGRTTDTRAGDPPVAAPTPAAGRAETQPMGCALGIAGAFVEVRNTDDGIDLTFVAPGNHADEMRRRVRASAAVYGPGAHGGPGHEGAHGMGDGHGLQLWTMPPVHATVDPTDRGAVLHLRPIDPTLRDELREKARQRAEQLDATKCE